MLWHDIIYVNNGYIMSSSVCIS